MKSKHFSVRSKALPILRSDHARGTQSEKRKLGVLRYLRDEKLISEAQYLRAKTYYRKLTGADITVPD